MPLVANEAGAAAPDQPRRAAAVRSLAASRSTSTSRSTVAEDRTATAVRRRRRRAAIRSSRKLELAEEFQRIGDKDGARDLLREVLGDRERRHQDQGAGHARPDQLSRAGRARPGARRRAVRRESRPRHRLSRQRLQRLAEPARRPHRAGPRRRGAQRVRRPRRSSRSAPGAPMPASTRSTRSSTSTPRSSARRRLGARHQPLPARRHRRPVVPLRARRASTRAPARSAGATTTCCSSRRCGPALESRARRLDLPPARRRRDAAAGQALVGEHDFSAFRSAECQALSPVKTMRASTIERRGAYWRFASTPTRSCIT